MRGFSKTQVVGFFLTGAAVGMAVALLYAPKSGVETRKQIRKFSKQLDDLQNDLREQISDGYQQVMEVFGDAKEYVQEGRNKLQKMIRTA
ncbi:MAG: hypothetical protein DMG19_13380 [Acidobacteria bacterium]|nr:MAG: hypothetical protein DMG19_13380 [Acidobacteriota bacterium]